MSLEQSDEPRAVTRGPGLAEDADEFQHPVLLRLRTGKSVGSAVRTGAAWAAGSRVVSQGVQFLGLIVTARLLVPADYGNQAVVAPLLAFAGLFASLGMGSAVIHARRVTEELLSTAFWINAAAGVVITGILAALALPLSHLFKNPTLVPLLLLASVLFTINLGIVHQALLERTMRFKLLAAVDMVSTTVAVLTIIVTAALGAGPFALVYGPLANMVVTVLGLWSLVRWRPRARPTRESARYFWTFSRGITGFNILNFWSRNADNLLLARYVSLTELGNYNRAYNLMKLPVGQMNVLMSRVLFPAMTRLRDDRERLAGAWLRAMSVAGAITAPLTVTMAVTAPALVEVLFGRRWLGMVPVLQLLAASALPQTLSTTTGGLLRAVGATDKMFKLGLVTSTLSVGAILVGLPWGTVGVAVALLVKFYVEVLITMRACLQQLPLRWRDLVRTMGGVWLACLSLVAAGLAVRLGLPDGTAAWQVLLLQLAAAGLAYVGTLWFTDRRSLVMFGGLLGKLVRRVRPA